MSSTRSLLILVATAACLQGCKGSQPPAPASPAVQPVASAQPVTAAPAPPAARQAPVPGVAQPSPQPAAQTAPVPPAFVYNPTGLRDPFEPFLKIEDKKPKEAGPKRVSPQTPLQRYSTEELKLVGVVWGEEGRARALIEDPQGKGYAVAIGTLVGDRGGKVARILPDRIVIEERFKDVLGEEKKNVANMMLHKSEGEVPK